MKNLTQITFLTIMMTCSGLSNAGVYSDDLSRCLVESATAEDKQALVVWMFTAMALHPDISSMSNVTAAQREEANKNVAKMFTKLMTESCLTASKKAVKYEGGAALEQGFNMFGQVAGQELFSNPKVAQALTELEEHIDTDAVAKKLELSE